MNKKRLALGSSQGFTLIEVVLVLAIGGLIFLLAFIAFQQVSRNRRDTQRRSDVARVLAELQNYAGDRSGTMPVSSDQAGMAGDATLGDFGTFINSYMGGSNFTAPNGSRYMIASSYNAYVYVSAEATRGMLIGYQSGHVCNGSGGITSAAAGNVAVFALLEGGSTACRDNR